jgi:3-oxoacyl-[acyl-carrier protein] reductase
MNRGEDRTDTQKSSVNPPGSGRAAIATGAGRGLGRAMTLGLARTSIRVVATAARERTEIETMATETVEAWFCRWSRTSLENGTRGASWRLTLERFGRLDILVNNAGFGMKYVSETS